MASQTQLMPTGSFARNQTVTTVEQFAELSNRVAGLAAEIGSLREQRQSMSTFERLRDALLRHYPTPPCKPPSVCRLEAQEFRGVAEGIYFLEHAPSGAAFHWTGPGHVTRFSLFVDRGVPVCVHLSLYLAGRLSESDTMSAEINGVRYPFTRSWKAGEFVAGPVPPRAGARQTDVHLHVPVVFSPDGGSGDNRRLGVAISSIALAPAD